MRGEVAGLELSVIHTGEIPMPQGYALRSRGNAISRLRAGLIAGDDALVAPCLAFAVRHSTAGWILIDTGFHADARTAPRREFGMPMSLLFRGLRPDRQPFDQQLRGLGIEPDTVRTVVMTHLHADHTSAMRLLGNARFTISRAEWQATRDRWARARGYVSHHLPPEEHVQLVDLDRDGEALGPFPKTVDLLGDGSIRLLSTPGHTSGHMSVLLDDADGRRVLLVGDAAYTMRNIREGILPLLSADDTRTRSSLEQIASFLEEEPETIAVPSHDPDAWRALLGPHPTAADAPAS